MTYHVVLVSKQTIPNISPTLDKRYKPETVIMLVSKDMQDEAGYLERIYRPNGINTEIWPIEHAWDINYIQEQVMALLIQYEQQEILLNVTGGTKPMAIAAYEVFRANDKAIFYVHPEKDQLIWMHPGNKEEVALQDRIKIEAYFKAYGAEQVSYQSYGVKAELRALNQQLIDHLEVFSKALGSLNYYAWSADNPRLQSADLDSAMRNKPNFDKLIDLFAQAGLLKRLGRCLQFSDQDSRFICNGGWLELYVHSCCLDLKQDLALQDVKRSVEVIRSQNNKNELDIVLLKDNSAYIIECKTRQFKKHSPDLDNTLYKLDSIRDTLGGAQCKAMLVNYQKLSRHHLSRAAELNINHCSYTELRNLKQTLINWINDKR